MTCVEGSGSFHRPWIYAIGVALLALAVRAPWLAAIGFTSDQTHFMMWSDLSRSSSRLAPKAGGFTKVYSVRLESANRQLCNYPPLYLYVLRILPSVYESLSPADEPLDGPVLEDVGGGQNTPRARRAAAIYKMPAVLADAMLGALLVIFLSRRRTVLQAAAVGAVYVLMPAVIHNSAMWGQVDAIFTLLLVISLEMILRRRLVAAAVFATLALLTKAQAAMMAPLWLAAALVWAQTDWRRWGMIIIAPITVALVVLAPFWQVLGGVWQAYREAGTYYPFTHLNGFNFWFLFSPLLAPHLDAWNVKQWYSVDIVPIFLNMTARTWGLLGVFTTWAIVIVRIYLRRADEASLFWGARVLPLAFFVFSTQMHERYLFPAIAIWAWTFVRTSRWWACWVAMSLCVAINVMWVWTGPADAGWAGTLAEMLHSQWLGVAPGTWCSLVLVTVLVLSLTRFLEVPAVEKENSTEVVAATDPSRKHIHP